MSESKIAVYGAIAANTAIAVTKFVVAGVTGSSAMLSEGVHSLVDTGNGALLLVGLHRSGRPASREHPFGHGKELYFWSLIVAVLIFGAGGGVSFYEGIVHIRDPEPLTEPFWNYVVLAAAAIFEGASLLVALHQFQKSRAAGPFWQALRSSKDPSSYTVLAEDSAALAGLAIAGAGVYFSHELNMPVLDGVASLLIGLLLAGVAVLLIRESRGLLIGEGLSRQTAQDIREIVSAHPSVQGVGPLLSMYLGAEEVLLNVDVVFDPELPAGEMAVAVKNIEGEIRRRFPRIRRIYIESVARLERAPTAARTTEPMVKP